MASVEMVECTPNYDYGEERGSRGGVMDCCLNKWLFVRGYSG